jgi:hypothetical protein
MSEEHEKHDDKGGSLIEGLRALDEAILKSAGEGEPGSGLYSLLSAASAQLLGVKAPAFPLKKEPVDKPVDKPAEQPKTEPPKTEPPKPAAPAAHASAPSKK